ncbi:MAG: hypothetical protein ABSG90_15060 [Dehalococcoidia bacterium]|jgi:hypothetical protein
MLRLEFPRTVEFPPAKREYEVNDFLTFSNAWPNQLGIFPGHTYQVVWREDVPYDLDFIIQAADWKDVNLADAQGGPPATSGVENLYPYGTNNTLYQMLIGFKPGNYMVHLYMPSDQYILGLEYTQMYPSDTNMASPKYKYIGSIKPEDSPHYDPRLKLVTVYNMLPFYLRFLVDTGDDEKCIANMIINHCQLKDVTATATPEQKLKNIIRYVTEIAFRNVQGVG